MKKTNPLFFSLVALMLLGACTDNREKELVYPASPTNGQVYVDPYGNQSVYNAALQYWMISSMINNQRVYHYYYPSSGLYRDQSMRVIPRSSFVNHARTASPSRSFFGRSNSSSKSSGTAKSGGFGSTGRSSSGSASS